MGQAVLFISINQNSFNNRSNIEKRIYNKKKRKKKGKREKSAANKADRYCWAMIFSGHNLGIMAYFVSYKEGNGKNKCCGRVIP